MSSLLKDAALAAWPVWLAAIGGGVDVSIDGAAPIKGIAVEGGAPISMERGMDVPDQITVRVLASEAGKVPADGRITVNGARVHVTDSPRTDVAGAITTIECSRVRPVPTEQL